MELMHEQSKIIPRFWIDDVYFTGLLLHGIPGINWFDFKNELKWSYYDFWDLGNTLKIYELYAKFLKFFKINAIDFYLSDFFVVLHSQLDNKEINYNLIPIDLLSSNENETLLYIWFRFKLEEDFKVKSFDFKDQERSHVKKLDFEIQGGTLRAIQNNLNRYDDWLCVWRGGMWDDECSSFQS
ncbi:hypothetical protein BpHYR1_023694 [Brachionus plicatilis]|uniref:Uncharacterized protein n=1 Tax=Brachionus plicatilis TaxID=10195 RepID=A0A3M7PF63_BRAPC|nr:hypothetical protein BpHYR1_023694 [Brachionus plicatilis]